MQKLRRKKTPGGCRTAPARHKNDRPTTHARRTRKGRPTPNASVKGGYSLPV